jgi:hypothetical protein
VHLDAALAAICAAGDAEELSVVESASAACSTSATTYELSRTE